MQGSSQALVLMWNNVIETEGFPAVAEVLRNLSPGFRDRVFSGPQDIPQMPALVNRGYLRCHQFFDRIEIQLANHSYLIGDEFSIADISLLSIVDFATWVELDAKQDRPGIARWYQKVSTRPSADA